MHTLLNWILQGLAVAGVTSVALWLSRERNPVFRGRFWWAALLVVLFLPVASLLSTVADPGSLVDIGTGMVIEVPAVEHRLMTAGANAVFLFLTLWMSLHAARGALAVAALGKLKNTSAPVPSEREARLTHWMRLKKSGRHARLALCRGVPTASVLGLRDPLIALAPALLDRLRDGELDRIVVHEWAHVQRRDDWRNAVQVLVRATCGWHPAIWWIDRQICREREAACDAIAARETGSCKAYAACLVKLAALQAGPALRAAPAALASSDVRDRVIRILDEHRHPTPSRLALAGVAIFITGVALAGRLGIAPELPVASSTWPASGPGVVATPDAGAVAAIVPAPRAATPRRQRAIPSPVRVRAANAPSTAVGFSRRMAAGYPRPVQLSSGVPELTGEAMPELPAMPSSRSVEPAPDAHAHARGSEPSPPWEAAARAGKAVERGSREAGLSTAGFFNRLGRRIAGAF